MNKYRRTCCNIPNNTNNLRINSNNTCVVQGPPGPMGPPGMMGIPGQIGLMGPTGPMGPTGASGVMGPAGARGLSGPTGPTGPTGPSGIMGPAGVQGLEGPTGATGPAGPMGAVGVQGVMGPTGPAGPAGPMGPPGPAATPGSAETGIGLHIYASVQNNTPNQTFQACEFITFPISTLSSNVTLSADLTTVITSGRAAAYLVNYGIQSSCRTAGIQLYHNGYPVGAAVSLDQMGRGNTSVVVLSSGERDSWQVRVVGAGITLPNCVNGFYMTIVGLN